MHTTAAPLNHHLSATPSTFKVLFLLNRNHSGIDDDNNGLVDKAEPTC